MAELTLTIDANLKQLQPYSCAVVNLLSIPELVDSLRVSPFQVQNKIKNTFFGKEQLVAGEFQRLFPNLHRWLIQPGRHRCVP